MLKLFILMVAPCATDMCVENYSKAIYAIEGEADCETVALIYNRNDAGRMHFYCRPAIGE